MSSTDDVIKDYLDQQMRVLAGHIEAHGEPDCFVVHTMLRAQIIDLVAVFHTRKALYREFPKLVKSNALQLSCVGWWFDDKD